MLQNMSTEDNKDVSICANCGKDNATNICNKCKMVKYCNAACKKKHRSKHKKACEEHVRLAAEKHNEELRNAAELHDKELFKSPPSLYGDCPICFLKLPSITTGWRYQTCCGKVICSGCVYAPLYDDKGNEVDNKKCPFCRVVTPKSEEGMVERLNKRVEASDAKAMYTLGCYYRDGLGGYPQDYKKALELFHQAGDIGYAKAYCSIGYAYDTGRRGLEVDKKKANYYYELAAMKGSAEARYNLGNRERLAGNSERAMKHYKIAVRIGDSLSLKTIKKLYTDGDATKDDYTKALQLYQAYLGEIKSKQRDEAAAAREDYRYY